MSDFETARAVGARLHLEPGTSPTRRHWLTAGLALLGAAPARAESAAAGEPVRPRTPPPGAVKAVQSLLPAGAVVRSITAIEGTGHQYATVVVYDQNPRPPFIYPRIAVLKDRAVVASFNLGKLDQYGDSFIFVDEWHGKPAPSTDVLLAAFRNSGNGAGSLFVGIARVKDEWRLVLLSRGTQGQLKIRNSGRELEIHMATLATSETIWGRHHYTLETFQFDEARGQYRSGRKTPLPGDRDPQSVVRSPLVLNH
jgi:hypothetical protein